MLFEFEIAEKDGETTTVSNSGSKIDYPTLSYTLSDLGTHTYTITEKAYDKNGVKSATNSYTLNVYVADEVRDGRLEITTAGADPKALDFINTYTVENELHLDAKKTMEGRNFGEGSVSDKYTFTVTADDASAPMPERTMVAIEPNEGNEATVDFGKIKYTLADSGKTYTYTVSESGTVPGVKNSAAKTLTVKVEDDGNGTLNVTPTESTELPLTFVNTYDAKGTATIQAKKTLEGRTWNTDEAYTFELSAADGAPMPEQTTAVAVAEGRPASFGEISYTLADKNKTYDYTITEVLPTDENGNQVTQKGGVTYTTTTHTAHVKVTDAGDGTLNTEVTYDGDAKNPATSEVPIFVNTYDAHGTVGLDGTKHIANRSFNSLDKYTFTVTSATEGAPMPERESVTIEPREGDEAPIDFGNINFALGDAGRTYVYNVTETASVNGVTNDTKSHKVEVTVSDGRDGSLEIRKTYLEDGKETSGLTFTNTYDAKGEYVLSGTKVMEGRDFNDNDVYTFTVKADSADAPMPERSELTIHPREGNSYDLDFGKIAFDLTNAGKAYTYTISERGSIPGVTNDISTHVVTVKVADNGDGTLGVEDDVRLDGVPAEGLTFTNKYTASGTATFDVDKKLTGKDLENGEFTFELRDASGTVLQTASNAADGTVAFSPLTYDLKAMTEGDKRVAEKTFNYTVTELLPSGVDTDHKRQDAMTYDTTVHNVSVTVTDNGRGTLETSVDYGEGKTRAEFENSYFAAKANIEFDKYYYGNDRNAAFNFELVGADESWNVRAGESGTTVIDATGTAQQKVADTGSAMKVTAINGPFDASGKSTVKLPEITYFEPGTYRYLLAEKASKDVQTDAAIYRITVVVDENQKVEKSSELVFGNASSAANSMAFYNNDQVTLGFKSAALGAANDLAKEASVEPKVQKKLENGSLTAGEFEFSLRDAQGRKLQSATNDASGAVAFDRIAYDEPGTYEYQITENAGGDASVVYDTAIIKYQVTVTADASGALTAKETYYDASGKVTTTPTFVNSLRTITVRAQKRSREAPYDPLVGSTYGIWMANANGNDVYMGNSVSDRDGYLYYDVPTTQGVAYYLLEEAAPHGHLVDPYPTDYFTIGKGKNGAYYLVYEYDSEFFGLVPELKGRI